MAIIIKPYKGIVDNGKKINFDMTQKEVEKALGYKAAKIEIDNIMEETREIRYACIYRYINKKLVDIQFNLNNNLMIKEIELFNEKDETVNKEEIIKKLKEIDTSSEESKDGYINFYKLGINLGGFGKKKIPEKMLVIAFSKERINFYKRFLKA